MNCKITYLFIVSLLFGSCGNFLEPQSESEFVPEDAASLNELLLGEAYPTMSGTGPKLNTFLALLDDDVACTPYQQTMMGQRPDAWFAAYSWQPDMYLKFKEAGESPSNYNIYSNFYVKIVGANAVLDYIGDVNDEPDAKNNVIAQGLALRAFHYFNLVNLFGAPYNYNKESPGVPLKLTSGVQNTELSRNTVEEVYNRIVTDLLQAERLYKTLPADMQWKQNYRVSLPMVQLLLSRVYLYMENWQKAAEYADIVIEKYGFGLYNLNSVPDKNLNGALVYTNFHTYDSPEVIWTYGNVTDVTSWVISKGMEDRVIFKASDELMAAFDESEGDLRKSRYVVRERYTSTNESGTLHYPQAFGKMNVDAQRYLPSGGSYFARSMRLAEAYLNLCEANAMIYRSNHDNNAHSKALAALNTLRKYRFSSADYREQNIADADQLLAFVQRERRRELCFEDHRWFDLRRWGMKEVKHVWPISKTSVVEYTLKQNDPGFTLPLPPEALDLNVSLVQNPLAPAPRMN